MLRDTEKGENGFPPRACFLTPPGLTMDSLSPRHFLPVPEDYRHLSHEIKNPLGFLPSCLFFKCTWILILSA